MADRRLLQENFCSLNEQVQQHHSQGYRFSAANFAKFHDAICEILQRYYIQILYIPQPVGIVVLTDNNSEYK